MEEYETDRSADEPKDSPRSRIAQNLKRQIDTVSERWSMLCQRSEDWQQWIDEVLRVSPCLNSKDNCFLFFFVTRKKETKCVIFSVVGKPILAQQHVLFDSSAHSWVLVHKKV